MAAPAFLLPALLGSALGGSTSQQVTVSNTATNQVAANPVNTVNIGGFTSAYPGGGVTGSPSSATSASQTTPSSGGGLGLPSFGGAPIQGDYVPVQGGGDIFTLIQENIVLVAIGAGALIFISQKKG